jgi:hypothetical protein
MYRQHGESGDTAMDGIEEILDHIKQRIAFYDLHDMYNVDETRLFSKISPNTTIFRRQIEGRKKNETRITVAFTCNAEGSDRFIPMFIGHARKPYCFTADTSRQYFYHFNKKA